MIRWSALVLVLLLSGCGAYHNPDAANATYSLKTALPQHAAVKKGQIEYYRVGKGSPIVLIAGYATDVTSWDRDFLAGLAKKHELIIFNNRNVSGSQIQSSSYRAQDLADDTYQLINSLHLKNVTVLGISMGGMIAQEVAIRHPDCMHSLVLINTAIAGNQSVRPTPEIEKEMLTISKNKLKRYILAVKAFFPPAWRIQMAYSLAADRFLPAEYKEMDDDAVLASQRKLLYAWTRDNQSAAELKKLGMPVLILNGEADTVIPPVNSEILARTIKHSRLIRWKDGGHAMIYQHPDEMAEVINRFV